MFVLHRLTIFSVLVNICSLIYNIFSCSLGSFIMNTIISIVFLFAQPLIVFFVLLPSLISFSFFLFFQYRESYIQVLCTILSTSLCLYMIFSIPLLYLCFLSFAYAISVCSGSSNTSVAGKVSLVWYNLHLVSFQLIFSLYHILAYYHFPDILRRRLLILLSFFLSQLEFFLSLNRTWFILFLFIQ